MEDKQKKVIALGFFDGVHLGHQALLRTAVQRAEELGMTPAVFTFDRSPKEFVTGVPVPLLTTAEERAAVVGRLFPITDVIVAPFDEKMMTMPWVDFVLMLAQEYNAGALVAGHDFRFGHRNAGTPALLVKKARQLGMHCDIVPAVQLDGVTVSSTLIRTLLLDGRVDEAGRLLGYPFALSGSICRGKGLGRRIGAPTVNLIPPAGQLIPAHGVYITRVYLPDGRSFPGVTNIGVRPTVSSSGNITVETFLLDFDGNLYDQRLRLEFFRHLRGEQRFADAQQLKEQIHRDIALAREFFAQYSE